MTRENVEWATTELSTSYSSESYPPGLEYVGSQWERKIDGEENDSYKDDKSLDKNGEDHEKPESALVTTDLIILDRKYDRSYDYPDPVEGSEGPLVFRLLRERWWTDVMSKALQENELLPVVFIHKETDGGDARASRIS